MTYDLDFYSFIHRKDEKLRRRLVKGKEEGF